MSTRRARSDGNGSADATAAGSTARRQRRIQAEQDRRDQAGKAKRSEDKKQPVQAGARRQPGKLPAQHIAKPGHESELALAPRFLAPDYRGSGKLEGFAAIVTGADSGIGRAVAVLFAREGADVTVAYLDEHDDAAETRAASRPRAGAACSSPATSRRRSSRRRWSPRTIEAFGRLDVVVNNAAFQEHAESIEDITEERLEETFRTNIFGYFHMAQAALPH
jgi:hypothetical protein